jgi:endonuclease/exonuclease/phosphatase family metal-dependent hydrolase
MTFYMAALAPYYGLSVFVKPSFQALNASSIPLAKKGEKSDLRSAVRTLIRDEKSGEALFWFVNTHLIHTISEEGSQIRADEVQCVLDGMSESVLAETKGRCIIVGDHNSLTPKEGFFNLYKKGDYVSAHLKAKGKEPANTWSTGIQAPFRDVDGLEEHPNGVCLDYVFVKGGIEIVDAGIAGEKCADHDKTLFASDHIGVWADVKVPLG